MIAGDGTGVTLRPIETSYAGRRFRSRLEARWAVFYTALNIPWVYEPEAFALDDDGGRTVAYLPDFYLPAHDCFVEIKPGTPSDDADRKAHLLAHHSGRNVFIFCGMPGYHVNGGYPFGQVPCDGAYRFRSDGHWDNQYTWCVCPSCGRFGIEFGGRSGRLPCRHGLDDKTYTYDAPHLLAAYDRANRARFCGGESC